MPQGVAVEGPGAVPLDDFRHAHRRIVSSGRGCGVESPPRRVVSGLHLGAVEVRHRSETPGQGAHVRQPERTPLLGTLLLVVAAGLCCSAPARTGPRRPCARRPPLGRVVPAPASVGAGGSPYRITPVTRIRVDGSRDARRIGDYLAGLLRPSTGYAAAGHRATAAAAASGCGSGRGAALGEEGYRLEPRAAASPSPPASPRGSSTACRPCASSCRPPSRRTPCSAGPGRSPAAPSPTPRASPTAARCSTSPGTSSPSTRSSATSTSWRSTRSTSCICTSRDDQGWRIAIDSWPRLATYGGSTQVGGGPGGYYTKAQYREIVAYAASRHLEVVPEIDMPGHTNAALASYAELNCDGVAPPLYTGTEVGFSSLCVAKEVTYDFVDDVVRELAALTPGTYLHIGGDEAHSTRHEDYVAFMDKVQPVVAEVRQDRGRLAPADRGDAGEGRRRAVLGLRRDTDAAEREQVAAAAKNGTGLVLSPADRAVPRHEVHQGHPARPGLGRLVEVRRAYDWDPGDYLRGVPAIGGLGRRGAAVDGDARPPATTSSTWRSRGCPASPSSAGRPRRRTTGTRTRCGSRRRGRGGRAGDRLLPLAAGALARRVRPTKAGRAPAQGHGGGRPRGPYAGTPACCGGCRSSAENPAIGFFRVPTSWSAPPGRRGRPSAGCCAAGAG